MLTLLDLGGGFSGLFCQSLNHCVCAGYFIKQANDSLIHIFFPNLIQRAPHLKLWKQRWKRRYPFCSVQAFLSWHLPFLFVCMNGVKYWVDGK